MQSPSTLLWLIFVALIAILIAVSELTRVRPETPRQWILVWMLLVFLAWALAGTGWLRSA